ncbi:endonuclease domain-containing protein [Lysobacter sp. TAF61]|uniref:endonuclease domain-containing protein n=1 Tax=Lysobacter sp. TAF61 TaxID=3233072 RepID=UPI003F9DED4F
MEGQTNRRISRERRPRKLRNDSTDAERHLWRYLRNRQLQGCKFRRQHPFGDYILDFACLERRLAIELDGAQHTDKAAYDRVRTRRLEQAGFVVLRFWNNEVFENAEGVVEVILDALRRLEPIPSQPSPLKGRASIRSVVVIGHMQTRLNPSPPNPPLEGEG